MFPIIGYLDTVNINRNEKADYHAKSSDVHRNTKAFLYDIHG